MTPAEQKQTARGVIMVVDDNPANLKLLEEMLRQKSYQVRSFPRGQMALAAVAQNRPDLILLDVNMPEMSGYEVCQRLKISEETAGIPVLFISALNQTEDKVLGFQAGGVDYISKPFQFEEVHARVETHLKLRRAQQAERDLLERTLGGAVGTLLELVQLTSPLLAMRAGAIRDCVKWIATQLALPDAWQCELAARLSLVGCLALPEDVFERAWRGMELSPDEERMFQAHPETAGRMIAKIPRLEGVAEIVRRQMNAAPDARLTETVHQGVLLLNLASQLDRKVFRGATIQVALAELRSARKFDSGMLKALESYSPAPAEFSSRRLPLPELRAGMILRKDVLSKDKKLLILKAGTVLTETWMGRLQNFAKTRGVQDLVEVSIPGIVGPANQGVRPGV